MAWVCDGCRTYTTDAAQKACPTCGVVRKFTLLAAPGETPEPVPDAPTTVQNRYGHGAHQTRNFAQPEVQSVGWEHFVRPLLIVIAVLLGSAGLIYFAAGR